MRDPAPVVLPPDAMSRYFALSNELLCIATLDGTFVQVNQEWERVLGRPAAELTSRPFLEFVHPEDRAATVAETRSLAAGGQTVNFQNRYLHADGSVRWLRWRATSDASARLVYGAAQDVTERLEDERELARERGMLQLLLQGTEAANRAATLLEAARAVLEIVCRHTAWTRGQLFVVNDGRLVFTGLVVPADAAPDGLEGASGQPLEVLQAVVRTGVPRVLPCEDLKRAEAARRHGYVRWHGVPIVAGGEVRAAFELFSRSEGADEATTRHILEQLALQLGRVREREVLAETQAQVRRDLEQVNRELRDFAAAASHELQEPLRKINAFGDRLARHAGPLPPEAADSLARMRSAAVRMSDLIEALAHLTRISTRPVAHRPVSLGAVVAEALGEMDAELRAAGADVVVGPLPEILGEPVPLRQVFLNLLGNALKYRSPERPLRVRVDGAAVPAGIRVVVSDNGIGFEPQHAERIFRPFQRLHGRSEYPGIGMGLALVRRIVERHGGTVAASSAPDEGAVFELTFPVAPLAGGGVP